MQKIKEKYEFKDYDIYPKTGQIINRRTKREVGKHSVNVALDVGAKNRIIVKKAKFIWEIVNGPSENSGDVFVAIDGDEANCSISNIKVMKRSEYFKDHDWQMKVKLTKEQTQAIKEEYATNTITNMDLAIKYKCSKSTIQKVITGTYYYDLQKNKKKKKQE